MRFSGAPDAYPTTRYVLTTDPSGFVGGSGIVSGIPLFADALNGDCHLMRNSPGVDFAPKVDGIDLDGNPRAVDLTDVPDVSGPEDLGAYEIQAQSELPDPIFHNGFDA